MRVAVVDAAVTTELRRAVLRPSWAVGTPMAGDDDRAAVHVAGFDGAQVVAAAVLFPRAYPLRPHVPAAWQLRGMATAADRQGQGMGGAVLHGALDELVGRGARLVWCEARISAQRFYERHGFRAEGEQFVTPQSGLPHFFMWRELSGTPTSSEPARRRTGA